MQICNNCLWYAFETRAHWPQTGVHTRIEAIPPPNTVVAAYTPILFYQRINAIRKTIRLFDEGKVSTASPIADLQHLHIAIPFYS